MRYPLLLILTFCAFTLSAQNDNIVRRGHKFIYTGDGKLFHKRYDSIRNFSEGRAAVERKGLWGFIDVQGKYVVNPKYVSVMNYSAGLAGGADDRYKWTIIDLSGSDHGWYDTIVRIDSLTLGYDVHTFAQWTYSSNIDIWKCDTGLLVQDADSYIQVGDKLILTFPSEPGRFFPYEDVVPQQIITTKGVVLTPQFARCDSVLKKPAILKNLETGRTAVMKTDCSFSPWYIYVTPLKNNYYSVGNNTTGKGIMDSDFTVIVPKMYVSIQVAGSNFICATADSMYMFDSIGKVLGPGFRNIQYLSNGIYIALRDYNIPAWEALNANGERISTYGTVYPEQCGIFRVVSSDYLKYAFMNRDGKLITPWYDRGVEKIPEESEDDPGFFDALTEMFGALFRMGVAATTLGASEMLGWFDHSSTGIPDLPKYNSFPGYNPNYAYFYGSDFRDGYALTSSRRKNSTDKNEQFVSIGMIDSTGQQVLKNEWISIEHVDTFFIVQKISGYGITDTHGHIILQPKYGEITLIHNAYFRVTQNTSDFPLLALYHVTGSSGKFLSGFVYDQVTNANDDRFMVRKVFGHYGYVNEEGKLITQMIYWDATPFKNGRARVKVTGTDEEYYIDEQGNRID